MAIARIYFETAFPVFFHEIFSKSTVENKSGRFNVFASTIFDVLLQLGETRGRPISAPHISRLVGRGLSILFHPNIGQLPHCQRWELRVFFTWGSITSILQSLNRISFNKDSTSSMKSTHLSLRSAMERTRIVSVLGS